MTLAVFLFYIFFFLIAFNGDISDTSCKIIVHLDCSVVHYLNSAALQYMAFSFCTFPARSINFNQSACF